MSFPSVVLTAEPYSMPIIEETSIIPRCVWNFLSHATLVSHFCEEYETAAHKELSSIFVKASG